MDQCFSNWGAVHPLREQQDNLTSVLIFTCYWFVVGDHPLRSTPIIHFWWLFKNVVLVVLLENLLSILTLKLKELLAVGHFFSLAFSL